MNTTSFSLTSNTAKALALVGAIGGVMLAKKQNKNMIWTAAYAVGLGLAGAYIGNKMGGSMMMSAPAATPAQ